MKINATNNNFQQKNPINFKGNRIENLLKVLPDTKISKGLTNLDKNIFQTYIISKQFQMGITADEIAELSKFDNMEYIIKAFELLTKKLAIPDNIKPGLITSPLPANILMGYAPILNGIYIDTEKTKNIQKLHVFSTLRHELQHYIQNCNILRHEEFGEKAVDSAAEKFIEYQKQILNSFLASNSPKELREALSSIPECAYWLKALDYIEAKDEEGLANYINKIAQQYKSEFSEFRQKIISNMGVIKKDSNLTPRIEASFKEFNNIGYYNPNGSIDYSNYFNTFIEQEAILAQGQAGFEYSQEPCFIRYAKKDFFETIKNQNNLGLT